MVDEHAKKLRPSSSPQWAECSGSVAAQEGIADIEDDETRRGKAAHWASEQMLRKAQSGHSGWAEDIEGSTAPNGITIDGEMFDAAYIYAFDVIQTCQKHEVLNALKIEQRVHMPGIHHDNWGTPDAYVAVWRDNGAHTLFTWDFKFGHLPRHPLGDWQTIDYVNGEAEFYGLNGLDDQRVSVVSRIVQPRARGGPIKEHYCMLGDYRPYWNQLAQQAEKVVSGVVELRSGPWCRDCKARITCNAARQMRFNLIDVVQVPYSQGDGVDTESLAIEYDMLVKGAKTLEKHISAIEDELKNRVFNGDESSHYKKGLSKGNLNWTCDYDQRLNVSSAFGADAKKDATLTPTQVGKKVNSKLREAFFRTLGELNLAKRQESPTLIPKTDARYARVFMENEIYEN